MIELFGKDFKIVYNNFHIDFNKPLINQIESLSEDLIQVEYNEKYLIDVGWYPEFNENGQFVVVIIKNNDWEKPLFKEECKTEIELKRYIVEACNNLNSCTS